MQPVLPPLLEASLRLYMPVCMYREDICCAALCVIMIHQATVPSLITVYSLNARSYSLPTSLYGYLRLVISDPSPTTKGQGHRVLDGSHDLSLINVRQYKISWCRPSCSTLYLYGKCP